MIQNASLFVCFERITLLEVSQGKFAVVYALRLLPSQTPGVLGFFKPWFGGPQARVRIPTTNNKKKTPNNTAALGLD